MDKENLTLDPLSLLPIGSIVQVSSPDNKSLKFLTRLIGIDNNKTIITEMPTTRQLQRPGKIAEDLFYSDRTLVMRVLAEGVIYAFKSPIVHTYHGLSRLLVTAYPEQIQRRKLRKETRFPCTIPADLLWQGERYSGALSNISHSGCQLLLPDNPNIQVNYKTLRDTGEAGEKQVKMEIQFPFTDKPNLLDVIVRSTSRQADGCIAMGTLFNGDTDAVKIFLEPLHLNSIESYF